MLFLCRLLSIQVWCTHYISLCLLHDYHVCLLHLEGDTSSYAEVHWYDIPN